MEPNRNIYIPQHFDLREFVPPDVYTALGANAWVVMDPRIVWTLDQIRMLFGKPITVNNWHLGGKFRYRGFRPRDYTETAARYGQHYMGRAVDFDIKGMSAEEFRSSLKMNPNNLAYRYITACEEGTNWIHLDVRPVQSGQNGILFIRP